MSDRFYRQQLEATGYAPGMFWLTPPQQNKQGVLSASGFSASHGLTKKELEALSPFVGKVKITCPDGRYKAPYIDAIKQATGVTLSKQTVKDMVNIIRELNND